MTGIGESQRARLNTGLDEYYKDKKKQRKSFNISGNIPSLACRGNGSAEWPKYFRFEIKSNKRRGGDDAEGTEGTEGIEGIEDVNKFFDDLDEDTKMMKAKQEEDYFIHYPIFAKDNYVLWRHDYDEYCCTPAPTFMKIFDESQKYMKCSLKSCEEYAETNKCYYKMHPVMKQLCDINQLTNYWRCSRVNPGNNRHCNCYYLPLCEKHIQMRNEYLSTISHEIPKCFLADCNNFRAHGKPYCWGHMCYYSDCAHLCDTERFTMCFKLDESQANCYYNIGFCLSHKLMLQSMCYEDLEKNL